MPRRTEQPFKCTSLADLTRQLLYAPVDKRAEHVTRAERLHDSLESEALYPQDYVVYRITGIAAVHPSDNQLVGEAVLADLRLLIDQLSHSIELRYDATRNPGDECKDWPMASAQELADRLGVSTKTISRWRKFGLRWRWVTNTATQKREVRYPADAVANFMKAEHKRISKASNFTKIDDTTRQSVIDTARQLADQAADQGNILTLNQAATQIAKSVGRAIETIRLTLAKHDREHPNEAIFANRTGPLSPAQKHAIADAYTAGVGVGKLTQLFQRTRSTIYRAIHDCRAQVLRARRVWFVSSALFERDDADEVILRPIPTQPPDVRPSQVPVSDLPDDIKPLYEQQVFTPEVEHDLWVRLHYLRYKAALLRDQLDPYAPRVSDMDVLDGVFDRVDDVRDMLIRANLPVVLAVAKQHLVDLPPELRSPHYLIRLLQVGNQLLIESADDYDPWGKQKTFARYLNWRLVRQFASEPTDDAGRAQRRIDAAAVYREMLEDANRLGVAFVKSPPAPIEANDTPDGKSVQF